MTSKTIRMRISIAASDWSLQAGQVLNVPDDLPDGLTAETIDAWCDPAIGHCEVIEPASGKKPKKD